MIVNISTAVEKKVQEKELVKGCLQKNRKYQKILFEMYFKDMMAVCLRYTKDEDEANDVLQDGFIKVFEKLELYKGEGILKGWVYSIMVRTAIDHYRKQQREKRHLVFETAEGGPVEAEIEAQISAEELLDMIQRLPNLPRMVFNLFAIDGFSHREISEELGISEGTSKWYLCEARKALKKMIEIYYPVKLKIAYAR